MEISLPKEPNRAFERLNQWWRLQYEIVEERTPTGRVPLLVALPNPREPDWYAPLHVGDERVTQPDDPEAHLRAPHTHLANLDAENPDAVLAFVNKWGLLGLWNVPEYRTQTPFLAPGKGLQKEEFSEPFSRWYLTDRFKGQRARHFHRFSEPLELFELAAKKHQEVCTYAALADNADVEEDARMEAELDATMGLSLEGCQLIPLYRDGQWRLGWQCRSLLDWIRLRTVLELAEQSIRQCSRPGCGRFFRPVDPRQTFCTTRCRNAYNQALSRGRKKARPLWERGNPVEQVAREVGQPATTVSTWVAEWEAERNIRRKGERG